VVGWRRLWALVVLLNLRLREVLPLRQMVVLARLLPVVVLGAAVPQDLVYLLLEVAVVPQEEVAVPPRAVVAVLPVMAALPQEGFVVLDLLVAECPPLKAAGQPAMLVLARGLALVLGRVQVAMPHWLLAALLLHLLKPLVRSRLAQRRRLDLVQRPMVAQPRQARSQHSQRLRNLAKANPPGSQPDGFGLCLLLHLRRQPHQAAFVVVLESLLVLEVQTLSIYSIGPSPGSQVVVP